MHQWEGDEANDAWHEQEYAGYNHAPNTMKLLETEDLREFDKDAIEGLTEELHEMTVGICDERADMLPFALPKEEVLAYLGNASIQLKLALNPPGINDKSGRIYLCLLRCKEHLEKVFGQIATETPISQHKYSVDRHSPTTSGSADTVGLSPEMLLTKLQAFLHEFDEIQVELQHIYELFCFQDRLWVSQCNEALTTLHALGEHLRHVREMLFGIVPLPSDMPSPDYSLMVKLYNIEGQVRSLASLIISLRAICQTKSKRVIRHTEEIRKKLEVLIQGDKDVRQMISLQVRQLQPQAQAAEVGRHLRLVHSIE